MNAQRPIRTGIAITILLACVSAPALADREKDKERGRGRGDDGRGNERGIQVDRHTGDRTINVDRQAPAIERRSSERVIRVDRPGQVISPGNRVVQVNSPYSGRDPRGIVIEGGRRTIPTQVHTQYQQRGWVIDKRYNHNHYYPPRGHVVHTLPPRHHVVHHHNVPYYFHAGVWYRSYNSRFVVAIPPFGVSIRVLPEIYTTIWVGAVPYYYAGGVYYAWRPEERVYVVTNPPTEVVNVSGGNGSGLSDELYIYPKQGQSDQQQATDRYECHRWGVSQTHFDPTTSNQNLSVSEQASKRLDYRRAMKACLDGRGYSVQ